MHGIIVVIETANSIRCSMISNKHMTQCNVISLHVPCIVYVCLIHSSSLLMIVLLIYHHAFVLHMVCLLHLMYSVAYVKVVHLLHYYSSSSWMHYMMD